MFACMKKRLLFSFFLFFVTNTILAQYNAMVDINGTGNFTQLQAAIDAAPSNSTTAWTIYIKDGSYKEKIIIPSNKPNIHLIGQSVNGVKITYDDYAGKPTPGGGTVGTMNSATVTINATDFVAINVTFENSFDYDSASAAGVSGLQAVAVTVNADRCAFKNCKFLGMQDTLYTRGSGNPRHYFYKCYIDGIIDFIFGSSVAIFDSCVVYPKARTGTGNSFITAANTTIGQAYGYWFKDCVIPSNTGATNYFLGRPWGNDNNGVTAHNKTVFFNTRMTHRINPLGWTTWNAGTNTSVITYGEYSSKNIDGTLLNISNRVSWSKQFTNADTVGYNILNIFNGWNPCSVRADFCSSPDTELTIANFKATKNSNSTILGWNICWALSNTTFEVYKSIDNGSTFQLLSSHTAINDTSINFSANDILPPSCSSFYYFIKTTNPSYPSTYSDTILVSSKPIINTTVTNLNNLLQGSTGVNISKNFQVSARNLSNNLTITCTSNFEISTDNINWTNSSSSIILSPILGSITNQLIYVRLNANTINTFNGFVYLTTNCLSDTFRTVITLQGEKLSIPLQTSNVIQQWDLTSNNLDNAALRSVGVAPTVPRLNRFTLSNGTQVSFIPAYSVQYGQAFGASANGDGSWNSSVGGPGGNLSRNHYVEFKVKPYFDQTTNSVVNVDSIIVTTAFYNTSSNTRFAVVYSKSNFTVDSSDIVGGIDVNGITLPSTANGTFLRPIILNNQTSGPTARYSLNLANTSLSLSNINDSLTIRLYYSCGSGSAGRYAMLKNVQIKGSAASTLPLKFIYFDSKTLHKNNIVLIENKWQTTNEINVNHYKIQRSIDAISFETIGNVAAKNFSNNEYSFFDKISNLNFDTYFYRIVGIDNDGKKTYSTIKKLTTNQSKTKSDVSIFPNPAKSWINISANQLIKTIEIYDALGKRVKAFSNVNNSFLKINCDFLNKGFYIIKTEFTNNQSINQKLLIQ